MKYLCGEDKLRDEFMFCHLEQQENEPVTLLNTKLTNKRSTAAVASHNRMWLQRHIQSRPSEPGGRTRAVGRFSRQDVHLN